MADYNVQMKQYNGAGFDNVYPYASVAQTLAGGGSASEVIAQARNGLGQIATGSYVGTGTFEVGTPPFTLSIGFTPKIVIIGYYPKASTAQFESDNTTGDLWHNFTWAGMNRVNGTNGSPQQPSWSENESLTVFMNNGSTQQIYYYTSNSSQTRQYAGNISITVTMADNKFYFTPATSGYFSPSYSNFTNDMCRMTFNVANVTYYWLAIG